MGLLDEWMGQSNIPIVSENGATERKRVSGGVSVVDVGNASKRLIAPAGTSRGLSLNPSDMVDDVFVGRMSLGIMAIGLIALVAFYMWTRDVQGGG